jgi:hypothetical protein
MKLTPWYPMSINPVRVGVYEVKDSISTEYRQWSGRGWSTCLDPIDSHLIALDFYSPQNLAAMNGKWRGVAK